MSQFDQRFHDVGSEGHRIPGGLRHTRLYVEMKYAGLVVLLAAAISSCRSGAAPSSTVTLQAAIATPSSPASATESVAAPTSIPRPSQDEGAITGRLVDHISGAPAREMVIYLGQLSPVTIGGSDSHLITVLPSSSPRSATDEQGYFAFGDIEPGTYAMIVWSPVNSWVVSDPETGLDILVTVERGAITDLGRVLVDLP